MKEKIINILADIRPEFDFVKSNDFIADGMLDSFDIILLVKELDKTFSVSIDGMDIIPENFKNTESINRLLVKNGVGK